MPGTGTLGKLFFNFFLKYLAGAGGAPSALKANSEMNKPGGKAASIVSPSPGLSVTWLVVRKIIRRKWLRRREKFVAALRDKIAAPPTGSEFVLTFGTGRDDHGAAGGGTENQSSIRRDANNPSAHRTRRTSPLAVILRGTRAL